MCREIFATPCVIFQTIAINPGELFLRVSYMINQGTPEFLDFEQKIARFPENLPNHGVSNFAIIDCETKIFIDFEKL